MSIKQDLKEFFEILAIEEETDSGRVFHPVTLGSCRVHLSERLAPILGRLKQYAED